MLYEKNVLNLSKDNVDRPLHPGSWGNGLLDNLPSNIEDMDIFGSILAVTWIWHMQISFVAQKKPNHLGESREYCPICIRDKQSGHKKISRHCVQPPRICHKFDPTHISAPHSQTSWKPCFQTDQQRPAQSLSVTILSTQLKGICPNHRQQSTSLSLQSLSCPAALLNCPI